MMLKFAFFHLAVPINYFFCHLPIIINLMHAERVPRLSDQTMELVKYKSNLDSLEENLFRKISQHFEAVFQVIEDSKTRRSPIADLQSTLSKYYTQFCEIFVQGIDNRSENIDQVVAFYTYTSFFGIACLDSKQNKARQMIEVLSKVIPVIGSKSQHHIDSPLAAGEELLKLEFKAVIDRFNRHSSHSSPPIRDLIDQINSRMIFANTLLAAGEHQSHAKEHFRRMIHKTNSLYSHIDSVDSSIRDLYKVILDLLAGDIDTLKLVVKDDILFLLKGYLIFIDPFLDNVNTHDHLSRVCQNLRQGNILELIYDCLNDTNRPEDILLKAKQIIPEYIIGGQGLYAYYLKRLKPDRNTEGSVPAEVSYLMSILNYAIDWKIDFFSVKPFIKRLIFVLQSIYSDENLSSTIEAFKSRVLEICSNTLDKRFNISEPLVLNEAYTLISAFLKSSGLEDVSLRLTDKFFQQSLKDSEASIDILFTVAKEAAEQDSFHSYKTVLSTVFPDSVFEGMINPNFNPTSETQDFQNLEKIRHRLGAVKLEGRVPNNAIFAFLQSYIELRQLLKQFVRRHQATVEDLKPDELNDIGRRYQALAKEFCHIPICYKMVFSALLAFRIYFLGTSDVVDDLIKANIKMRRQIDVQSKLGGVHSDTVLLNNIQRTANTLLLDMRANCTA